MLSLHLFFTLTHYLTKYRYANETRLKKLVGHYSEFVTHPIHLRTTKTETVEIDDDEDEDETLDTETKEKKGDIEISEDDEIPKDISDESTVKLKPKKTQEVTTVEWEEINNNPAIWTRDKTLEHIQPWLADPRLYLNIALLQDKPVGVAMATLSGRLALCYVLPEWFRRGAGRAHHDRRHPAVRADATGRVADCPACPRPFWPWRSPVQARAAPLIRFAKPPRSVRNQGRSRVIEKGFPTQGSLSLIADRLR